ncbi:MAG: hypothetical protein RL196_610 [Actinomycetota bacterium]
MQLAKKLVAIHFLASVLGGTNIVAAQAHASLVNATPRQGQVLKTAPKTVSLTFDDDLTQIDGQSVNEIRVFKQGASEVDLDNSAVSGATVTVGLSKLTNGIYSVIYRVLSADGHPVSGQYQFRVAIQSQIVTKPKKKPASKPSASQASNPTQSPKPAPSQSGSKATPSATDSANPTAAATPTSTASTTSGASPSATTDASSEANAGGWFALIGAFVVLALGWVAWRRFSPKR